MTTDFPAATRLLDAIIAAGCEVLACAHQAEWLAGDIEIDMMFRFLAARTKLEPDDVQTTLAYLHCAGYVRARFDINPEHAARITLTLPAGAVAA